MSIDGDHLPLFLGLAGTLLTLIGSIVGGITNHAKTSLALMLAVAVCAIVTAQQVISYQEEQQKNSMAEAKSQQQELMQESRGILIKSIRETVLDTRNIVNNIASTLEKLPIDRVATAMVDVPNLQAGLINVHAKSSAEAWKKYADWLGEERAEGPEEWRCLSITLNAGRNYVSGLLLAYLYTGQSTREAIGTVIQARSWSEFPDADFIHKYGLQTTGVQCLLVFNQNRKQLVGFAHANRFAQELLTYQELGLSERIEVALNENAQIDEIARLFPSISVNVLEREETRLLVEKMVSQQIAEAAVLQGEQPYLLELQKIIRLAATPD